MVDGCSFVNRTIFEADQSTVGVGHSRAGHHGTSCILYTVSRKEATDAASLNRDSVELVIHNRAGFEIACMAEVAERMHSKYV